MKNVSPLSLILAVLGTAALYIHDSIGVILRMAELHNGPLSITEEKIMYTSTISSAALAVGILAVVLSLLVQISRTPRVSDSK